MSFEGLYLVVSDYSFYSGDPSSNPAEFHLKHVEVRLNMLVLYKNGPSRPLFVYFRPFSHYNSNIKWKNQSVDIVFRTRTRAAGQ